MEYSTICVDRFGSVFFDIIATGLECKGTIQRSVENILGMHRSMNEILSSMSPAKYSTVSSKVRTPRSPMRGNKATRPSVLPISLFYVHSCGELIDLMVASWPCSGKALLIRL